MLKPLLSSSRRRRLLLLLGIAGLLGLGSVAWPLPGSMLEEGAVVSVRVTDRTGGLLREVRPDGRGHPVPLEAIHPDVVTALLATEDRRFYRHFGIDPIALARALRDNLRAGRIVSGGSTLTMQVARALRGSTRRGVLDKLAEMHLALRLEWHLSKREILALWLNRVTFGDGTHGIEAAAQHFFGKAARDLTLAEATFLIGLPQSPSRYHPFRYPERARARQQRVLAAMVAGGDLSADDGERLGHLPLALTEPHQAFLAPHLVEYLLRGADLDEDIAEVRTTIDPALQRRVEALARTHVRHLSASGVTNVAAIVLDNRSGAVLAYLGSADFWNDRALGQNDGVRMRRQPGSTLKPFVYGHVLAVRQHTPASILPDLEMQVLEAGGAFSPENYDQRYHGPVPLRQALACSYNVPAVHVAREIGPAPLLQTLRRSGFASLEKDPAFYGVGLALGNGEVQLRELAQAYAGLARGGSVPAAQFVAWQRTATGDTLHTPPQPPAPGPFGADVAFLLTDILRDPEARAPAFGRGSALELPFPGAVKTGTSKDYRDNWAIGYTPRHTVAVWAGNFDGAPMQWVSGVSGAGPLLRAIFLELGSGGDFAEPDGIQQIPICPHSGHRPSAACPAVRREVFLTGTAPTDTCTVHRLVQIDRASGLLADASTPPEAIETKRFTVYPPAYHAWMREQAMPFPPEVTHADLAQTERAARYSDRLRVQYPEDGTTFRLDPVLRVSYQQVHLRGAIDTDLFDVRWWVNDEPLDAAPGAARLPLTAGKHRIELRAVTATGERLQSRPVHITVQAARHTQNRTTAPTTP